MILADYRYKVFTYHLSKKLLFLSNILHRLVFFLIEIIRTLAQKLTSQYRVTDLGQSINVEDLVIEMIQRDLLNIAFGNSDNHGRNTALIKRPEAIWLSPLYDFVPMKADPEGIVRVTQWGSPYEEGGNFNWQAIITELSDLADPNHVFLAFQ
ncbi:HipA domain-containing protein [Yersinia kristensenii]|uniref:HipA domain-containing protein n=1 Tax=Yersinia kristensenii TaxID=28152 RepID=UPI0021557921|nr:HipA domain-containing protein [Yersinia kristensenii]